jgi:hypothetical protein
MVLGIASVRYSSEESPDAYRSSVNTETGACLKVPIWQMCVMWQEESLTRGGVGKSEVKAILERILINNSFKTVFMRQARKSRYPAPL